MTLYEFKLMDLNDQAETVWNNGVMLEHRDEGQTRLILYRIDNFFAEVHYEQELNKITGIKEFVSDAPLQPYLDQINIVDLLNK